MTSIDYIGLACVCASFLMSVCAFEWSHRRIRRQLDDLAAHVARIADQAEQRLSALEHR